jgi:hypothetical protein
MRGKHVERPNSAFGKFSTYVVPYIPCSMLLLGVGSIATGVIRMAYNFAIFGTWQYSLLAPWLAFGAISLWSMVMVSFEFEASLPSPIVGCDQLLHSVLMRPLYNAP